MLTTNPMLSARVFNNRDCFATDNLMTMEGTVKKTCILLFCTAITATLSWTHILQNPSSLMTMIQVGGIAGFILAIATSMKAVWSPVTAPLYACAEGVVLGGISGMLEMSYPGIAFQAISLTFGTLFAMLIAYSSNFIQVTNKFKMGVFAATGGICLVYLLSFVLSLFKITPFFAGNGAFSIGFSLFVVAIAALNLVLDFDRIKKGEQRGLPKHMEWYSAFALMVTLIWLYVELLNLLSKIRSKDRN